jgi:uncharacterized membrane protein YdbT with pleckstrin-like domain
MAGNSYVESLLGQGEEIGFSTRQHWVALMSGLVTDIVVVIILLLLLVGIDLPSLLVTLGLIVLLGVLLHMARGILVWMSNQFIVTNRRVIHIYGVLSKTVSNTELRDLSDTRIQQSALGRLLDYANITILTASEAGSDRFTYLWHPQEFHRAVFDSREKLESRTRSPQRM